MAAPAKGSAGVTEGLSNLNITAPSPPNLSEVIKREDAIIQENSKVNRNGQIFPLRPDFASGMVQSLLTNSFPLFLTSGELKLLRYSIRTVKSVPTEDKARNEKLKEPEGNKKKQIIALMLELADFRGLGAVTDFGEYVYTLQKIERSSYTIRYRAKGEDTPSDRARVYVINLELASKELDIVRFVQNLCKINERIPTDVLSERIQVLNILLNYGLRISPHIAMIGSNKVFALVQSARPLGAGLVALRGYFSSIRPATSQMLVNINITHGVFYQAGPLEKLMLTLGFNSEKALNDLHNFLIGLKVKTSHLKDKDGKKVVRIRTISGLAFKGGDEETDKCVVEAHFAIPNRIRFLRGPSDWITVQNHFRNEYRINSGRYPAVNVGTIDKPSFLPAEACEIVPGQRAKVTLSESQTRDFNSFAIRKPEENCRSLHEGLSALQLCPPSEQLENACLAVEPHMMKLNGRLLAHPKLKYSAEIAPDAKAKWNLQGLRVNHPAPYLERWAMVRVGAESRPSKGHSDLFIAVMKEMGVSLNPKFEEYDLDVGFQETSPDEWVKKLQKQMATSKGKQEMKLMLVILPRKDTTMYNHIKKCGDTILGCHTVCVVNAKNKFKMDVEVKDFRTNNVQTNRNLKGYFANIALKFNLKLGGINHTVNELRGHSLFKTEDTMVVGMDVTHPTEVKADEEGPSIVAMVANIDKNMSQWPVQLRVQVQKRQEMVHMAGEMFESRLSLWAKHHNNTYPKKILFYRDGVSEGQYQDVLNIELKAMKDTCRKIYAKAEQPRLTLVIVGKRHHTRFYTTDNSNPRYGTVVDRSITCAWNWDFFLQSHHALIGIAHPAHYFILFDEIFIHAPSFVADKLHYITYWLCWISGRATTAIGIVAPVYYADMACERAGRYLKLGPRAAEAGDWTLMDDGQKMRARERVRVDFQRRIEVHERLRDSMFYV